MADTSIKINDNGPLVVRGLGSLEDANGSKFEIQEAIALCRCGHSSNKPFCDGAHKKIGFTSD